MTNITSYFDTNSNFADNNEKGTTERMHQFLPYKIFIVWASLLPLVKSLLSRFLLSVLIILFSLFSILSLRPKRLMIVPLVTIFPYTLRCVYPLFNFRLPLLLFCCPLSPLPLRYHFRICHSGKLF